MHNFFWIVTLALVSLSANASIHSALDAKPVTQDDIALIKLELKAEKFNRMFGNSDLEDTKFEVIYIAPKITDDKFLLTVYLKSKSRYLNDENCKIIEKKFTEEIDDLYDLNYWYNITTEETKKFKTPFNYEIILVDRENHQLKFKCE